MKSHEISDPLGLNHFGGNQLGFLVVTSEMALRKPFWRIAS